MSDKKRDDARERRLYRRHRRNERGVSPVVATIILVAIAVAAAAALYLFIQHYQSTLQSGISSNNVNSQYHFTIGGSTTVYPLSQLAIKWFEANNSLYNISDSQGGSVAGAEAYCAGQVDVGASSSSFTTAQLTGDGCSSALASATVQNVVAVDAIVGIASVNNPIFGTTSGYSAATFASTYSAVLTAGGATTITVTLPTPGGTLISASIPAGSTTAVAATTSNGAITATFTPTANSIAAPPVIGNGLTWTVAGSMGSVAFSIPATTFTLTAAGAQTVTGSDAAASGGQYGGTISATSLTAFSFNATTMLAAYVADSSTAVFSNTGYLNTYAFPAYICGSSAATVATWTNPSIYYQTTCPTIGHATSLPWGDIPFPAGCAVQTAATVWNFANCNFGTANTHTITAYDRSDSSGTSQGFMQKYVLIPKDPSSNSCGTDNQPVSCGITVTGEVGNPALAAAVAADANGLGYNSYGQAKAQVAPALNLAGYASVQVGSTAQPVIQPTVQTVLQYGYEGKNPSAAYGPWRVLEYLTDGTPTPGSAQALYLNFVLGPEVNLGLAQATGYISLYAA